MRAVLSSLFVEYYTDVKDIIPEAAWDQANAVYKRLQKTVAIPYVTKLISSMEMTPLMRDRALQNIEIQKKL